MIATALLAAVVGLLWAGVASATTPSVVPAGYPGAYNWQFQDLDGPGVSGGNGRSSLAMDVGAGSSSVIYNGIPHTFYRSGGVLRHGWAPVAGWNFETLDGAGGPTGQTTNAVGSGSSAVVFGNDLHVFYDEVDTGVLRHSWYSAAANAWFAERLDGPDVAGDNGRTANAVGGETAVALFAGTPHVFYLDTTDQDLRHAWWTGSTWQFETLDGAGGPNGRVTGDIVVGNAAVAVPESGLSLQVFYRDDSTRRLRQGGYDASGSGWQFQDLDGPGVPGGAGRQNEPTGATPTAVVYRNQPHVFYSDDWGNLRQAFVNSAGVWRFVTLQASADCGGCLPGFFPAATLYNGRPAVSHFSGDRRQLLISVWSGSQWQQTALDGANVSGGAGRVSDGVGLSSSLVQYGVQLTVQYGDETTTRLRQGWFGPAPPLNSVLPTIQGTATVTQTLTLSSGLWTNAPTNIAAQWQRCPVVQNGVGCIDIPGAILSTYTVTPADTGFTLRARVTATNGFGSGVAFTTYTSTVPSYLPVNTAAPVVFGTAVVGQTLSTDNGTWTNSPTSYAYKWQRCDTNGANCVDIAGATSSTYSVTVADIGAKLRSVVTATNIAGTSAPASSSVTAVVASPPVNTAVPVISGTATVGQTLSTTNGTWQYSPTSYAYQWYRCDALVPVCTPIQSATSSSYLLAAEDEGFQIYVTVVATNGAGPSLPASSASTATVTLPPPPVNTSRPVISGTPQAGRTLSTTNGGWSGSPTSYTYQWQRCDASGQNCVDIDGATSSTYDVVTDDAGSELRVKVTATNPGGSTPANSLDTNDVTRSPALEVAQSTKSPGQCECATPEGMAVARSSDGRMIVTGFFGNTAMFGSGQPNQTTLTADGGSNMYVASYDATGQLLWARSAVTTGGAFVIGSGVAVANDGSIKVTGYKQGDAMFGAGEPNETTLTASGFSNPFVASYDAAGTLQWARQVESNFLASGTGVAVAGDGSTVLTGQFLGDATFGAGRPNETTLTNSAPEMFLASYDAAGELQWARDAGGPTAATYGEGVAVAGDGSISTVGYFAGSVTFGAGQPNETTLNSGGNYDMYLASYDAAGELLWVRQTVGAGGAYVFGYAIAARADGSTAVTGSFSGSTTFGAGDPDETTLTAVNSDVFVASYDASGTLRWAISAGGGGGTNAGRGISVATDGTVAVTGLISGIAVFGAEERSTQLIGSLGGESFVANYTAGGLLRWVTKSSSPSSVGRSVAVATDGSVAATGGYGDPTTFCDDLLYAIGLPNCSGPLISPTTLSTNGRDMFLVKFAPSPLVPSNTTKPAVFGTVAVGDTLTTTTGQWASIPVSFAYRWQRCTGAVPEGGPGVGVLGQQLTCTDIPGATSSTYTIVLNDVGYRLRSKVTATNAAGTSESAYSAITVEVQLLPTNLVPPNVTGTPEAGQELSATDGLWVPPGQYYSYQWQRCDAAGSNCVDIPDATGLTYTATNDDVGYTLRVVVTATNNAGTSAPSESAETGAVTAAPVPVNETIPQVTGTAAVGETLSTTNGTWTNDPTSYAYQWQRCDENGANCVDIPNATSSDYTVTVDDVGYDLRSRVVATNGAGDSTPAESVQGGVPPTVDDVTPGNDCNSSTVTIYGVGFTRADLVSFGSVPAISFTVVSDTQIIAIAPSPNAPYSGLTVSVAVSNRSGSLTNAYQYCS